MEEYSWPIVASLTDAAHRKQRVARPARYSVGMLFAPIFNPAVLLNMLAAVVAVVVFMPLIKVESSVPAEKRPTQKDHCPSTGELSLKT